FLQVTDLFLRRLDGFLLLGRGQDHTRFTGHCYTPKVGGKMPVRFTLDRQEGTGLATTCPGSATGSLRRRVSRRVRFLRQSLAGLVTTRDEYAQLVLFQQADRLETRSRKLTVRIERDLGDDTQRNGAVLRLQRCDVSIVCLQRGRRYRQDPDRSFLFRRVERRCRHERQQAGVLAGLALTVRGRAELVVRAGRAGIRLPVRAVFRRHERGRLSTDD